MNKKRLVIVGMSLCFVMTGCKNSTELQKPTATEHNVANEESHISETNPINLQKEDAWVVDEYKETFSTGDNTVSVERALTLINEQGDVEIVSDNQLAWQVVEVEKGDAIYYITTEGSINCYTPKDKKTVEIGSIGFGIESAEIVQDEKTKKYYAIMKKYDDGSGCTYQISVVNLVNGQILVDGIFAEMGKEIVYDGKLYYEQKILEIDDDEFIAIPEDAPFRTLGQINTVDLVTGENQVFFNAVDYFTQQGQLELAKNTLGICSNTHLAYYENNYLLLRIDMESEGGTCPTWMYAINLVTGETQPLGSLDTHHPIASGSLNDVFIKNEKVYALNSYSDGSKALNVFDLKAKEAYFSEADYSQTPLGRDEKYIYMYDNTGKDYWTADIMRVLKENDEGLYKLNIETLQEEAAKAEELPPAQLDYQDQEYYVQDIFKVTDETIKHPISNEMNGLFIRGEQTPFYTTSFEITDFKKITMLTYK